MLLYVALLDCLSKYPPQNTRQASVLMPESGILTWHILHILFLFEFLIQRSQSRIERDFSHLTKKMKELSKIPNSRNSAKLPANAAITEQRASSTNPTFLLEEFGRNRFCIPVRWPNHKP
jgi:hypothetical protein